MDDHEPDSLGLRHDPDALDTPLNAAAVCEKRSNRAAARDRHELAAAYAQAAALYLITDALERLGWTIRAATEPTFDKSHYRR